MKKIFFSLALLISLLIVVYSFVKYIGSKTIKTFPEAVTKASPALSFIPEDLTGCFGVLEQGWPKDKLEVFKSTEEAKLKDYDLSKGKEHIFSFWGLDSDSRLARYFNKMGIYDSGDMFYIIMISFHRYLNNKDIRLQEQLDHLMRSEKE